MYCSRHIHIYHMGIIMRTSAALPRGTLTRVVLPLNQLSSSFAAGCTGLEVCRLMASFPLNMAFPPKLVEVLLLLKLPSSSLGSALKERSDADIRNVRVVWCVGFKGGYDIP